MGYLPKELFGDSIVIVGAKDWNEGKGDTRHRVGTRYTGLVLFDACAPITISVEEREAKVTQDTLTERNAKLDFAKAHFSGLSVQYSGGDFGAIVYRGTADSVDFINLTSAPGATGK